MGEPRRLEEDLVVPRSWQLRHLLLPTYTRTATQTSPNHGLLSFTEHINDAGASASPFFELIMYSSYCRKSYSRLRLSYEISKRTHQEVFSAVASLSTDVIIQQPKQAVLQGRPILRCVYRSEVTQRLSAPPQKHSATHWSFARQLSSEMQTNFAMKHLSCSRLPRQQYRRWSGLRWILWWMLTMLSSSDCLSLPLQ